MRGAPEGGQIRAQAFEIPAKKGLESLQRQLDKWLAKNPAIEVVSTNFAGFGDKIGYVVLYRERAAAAVFEAPPLQEPVFERAPSPGPEPIAEPVPPQEAPRNPRRLTTGAIFGSYDPFSD